MGQVNDHELIRQTIALYCQLLDDQRYQELGELFSDDAVLPWEGNTFHGRAEIVQKLPATQRPKGTTRHLPFAPVINVDGEVASAWTDVMVTVHPPEGPALIGWVGRYHQRFVRVDSRWRITLHHALTHGEPLPEGVEEVPGAVTAGGDGS
ncbi:MAG: hypothetical protein JWL70_2829 [Acidimicrobiia bacterium]|nr:hypothetical protein [Acidimicrobiia bacterium]